LFLIEDVLPFLASSLLQKIAVATPLTGINWVLYLTWMCCLAFFATGLTIHVYPVIAGSGIPEIRAILSGASLPLYLKAGVTPVKVLGVLAMVSSGLWVGKEGYSEKNILVCVYIVYLLFVLVRLCIFLVWLAVLWCVCSLRFFPCARTALCIAGF
jgi:hypothetical protein